MMPANSQVRPRWLLLWPLPVVLVSVLLLMWAGSLDAIAAVGAVAITMALAVSIYWLAGRIAPGADSLRADAEASDDQPTRSDEIVTCLDEGVLMVDAADRVELTNAAFDRLFGLADSPVGLKVGTLPEGHLWQELSMLARATAEGHDARLDLAGPDESSGRNLRVVATRMPSADGVLLVLQDVTEIARLARSRRDLVANVSHELKTPLTAIRGYAETLAGGALAKPEVAARFTGSILDQCARLEALLGDLLTLSRTDSRTAQAPDTAVDLAVLARRVVELLEPRAGAAEVALACRVDGEPLKVLGVEGDLEQMLVNLVENAIKYNRPGGTVALRLEAAAEGALVEGALVEIRDTGIGIPAAALPRIFERFYRVDKGRSRDQGGTGLGLAIVKGIARGHGGRVEVESELGRGSVFRVFLPDERPRNESELG